MSVTYSVCERVYLWLCARSWLASNPANMQITWFCDVVITLHQEVFFIFFGQKIIRPEVSDFSWFGIFNRFFHGFCGESVTRIDCDGNTWIFHHKHVQNIGCRPEVSNWYSVTAWPELIVVIHCDGEYIPPGTHVVNLLQSRAARTPASALKSWRSLSPEPGNHQYPLTGPVPQRSDLSHPHPLDSATHVNHEGAKILRGYPPSLYICPSLIHFPLLRSPVHECRSPSPPSVCESFTSSSFNSLSLTTPTPLFMYSSSGWCLFLSSIVIHYRGENVQLFIIVEKVS